MSAIGQQTKEFFCQLKDLYVRSLVKHGVSEENASEAADEMELTLRQTIGGHTIYVGKNDIERRNSELYRQFNGHNHVELAKQYGISKKQVYEVIATVEAAIKRDKQPGLFD